MRRAEVCTGAALLLALLLTACNRFDAEPAHDAVPRPVREALMRGINFSRWFDHRDDPSRFAARHEPDDADLRQLAAAGFRHLRLVVDPAYLLESDTSGELRPAALAELRMAIGRIRRAGLLTVLALQPREGRKARISEVPEMRAAFARFWTALAGALAEVPPEVLVFELLNEPETESAARSRAMYAAVIAAVRTVAPRHTLVVSGHRWSSVDDLLALEPLDDRNLVYGFHFYEPQNFTHQGADWGWPMWRKLAGLPYPSSPEAVQGVLEFLPAEARPHALQYGREAWDRGRLAQVLDRAARYAHERGLTVWCSEFGVYRYNVHRQYRLAWLRDVRELLEERQIGWSLWNYAGHFGLVQGQQGQRTADVEELRALGLNPRAFADG